MTELGDAEDGIKEQSVFGKLKMVLWQPLALNENNKRPRFLSQIQNQETWARWMRISKIPIYFMIYSAFRLVLWPHCWEVSTKSQKEPREDHTDHSAYTEARKKQESHCEVQSYTSCSSASLSWPLKLRPGVHPSKANALPIWAPGLISKSWHWLSWQETGLWSDLGKRQVLACGQGT